MSLVELASITGASGECKRTPERIREEIAALVEEYHQVAFVDGAKRYEPGVSPVPFGGRVFDADEMRHLVDSSLDFWLTAGRFSRQFEKEFARYFGLRNALLVNSGSLQSSSVLLNLPSSMLWPALPGLLPLPRGQRPMVAAISIPPSLAMINPKSVQLLWERW